MLLLYFISSALYLLLNIAENEYSVLSRVVVVTIMMSHLIHFITTLLREMARGIHQYDAVVEALVITHQPILLSSLTTILGFVVISIFNQQFSVMAYQVIIGVGLSYLSLLVVVPVILMNWLLEFRVGHYADRHGLDWVLKLTAKYPSLVIFSKILFAVLVLFLLFKVVLVIDSITALLSMLLVSFVLLLSVWKKLTISFTAILIALSSVLLAVTVLLSFDFMSQVATLVLLVPIGIVLDDVVHFFTRYIRAESSYITQPLDKMKYSLNSVGKSIWLTSQLLIVGMVVLLFSNNQMVVQASLVTIIALICVSFILLWLLPIIFKKN